MPVAGTSAAVMLFWDAVSAADLLSYKFRYEDVLKHKKKQKKEIMMHVLLHGFLLNPFYCIKNILKSHITSVVFH